MTDAIDYVLPSLLTNLDGVPPAAFAGLATEDPVAICRPVNTLVVHRDKAQGLGLAPHRLAETKLRLANRIIETLLALDGAPLSVLITAPWPSSTPRTSCAFRLS